MYASRFAFRFVVDLVDVVDPIESDAAGRFEKKRSIRRRSDRTGTESNGCAQLTSMSPSSSQTLLLHCHSRHHYPHLQAPDEMAEFIVHDKEFESKEQEKRIGTAENYVSSWR
jgi:hypothetical protein